MDSRALQQFLTLARTLHFGRAAEACHLSPSTLSRSIKRLEAELGCRLFERSNRDVSLTGEGRVLLGQAEELMERLQALEHKLQSGLVQLEGSISLYCSVTACYSLLSGLLPAFRQRYPGVEVKVHTGDEAIALQRIEQREEDVAIAARPDQFPDKLDFLQLATSPLVFIASLDVVGEVGERFWESFPLVLPEAGLARVRVDQWLRSSNIEPNIYAQVTGNEAIVSMVALGCGVGVVPLLVLRGSPFADRVRVVDVEPTLEPFRIGLCARKSSFSNPLLRALWDLAGERMITG